MSFQGWVEGVEVGENRVAKHQPPTLNDFFTVGCVMFFNLHFVCFCEEFHLILFFSPKRNWKRKHFPSGPFCRKSVGEKKELYILNVKEEFKC